MDLKFNQEVPVCSHSIDATIALVGNSPGQLYCCWRSSQLDKTVDYSPLGACIDPSKIMGTSQ